MRLFLSVLATFFMVFGVTFVDAQAQRPNLQPHRPSVSATKTERSASPTIPTADEALTLKVQVWQKHCYINAERLFRVAVDNADDIALPHSELEKNYCEPLAPKLRETVSDGTVCLIEGLHKTEKGAEVGCRCVSTLSVATLATCEEAMDTFARGEMISDVQAAPPADAPEVKISDLLSDE